MTEHYDSPEVLNPHEKWLEKRKRGIGGSDASSVIGANPWKSNQELWEEKTGRRVPDDIGDKPAVKYGKESEKPLRELFALDFPQFEVSYDEFGMIANIPDCPWLFATLDGELTEIGTKKKGVLEIKTTTIRTAASWVQWKDQVPQHYYIQVLHQLLATGYDFAILKAQLKDEREDLPENMKLYVRHYRINAFDVKRDMNKLFEAEKRFWWCVEHDERPPLKLPEI